MPRYRAVMPLISPGPVQTRCRPGLGLPDTGGDDARLRVSLAWSAERCVVTLNGSLDQSSAVAVATQFDQLIRASFDEVVFELSGVSAFDYSGAAALVDLWAKLRLHGVACRVDGLAPGCADDPREFLNFAREGDRWSHRLCTVTGAG